jgi:hypothetical protein
MTLPGPEHQQTHQQPQYFPPPPYGAIPEQRQPEPARPRPQNGFGVTALVLAIVGLVFGLVPYTGFVAFLCGVIGVVFGLLGIARVNRRIADNRVISSVGSVLSACAVLLGTWGLAVTVQAVGQWGRDHIGSDLGGSSGGGTATGAPASGQIGGEGTYLVGTEIAPGTYRTSGPSSSVIPNCYWARSKDATGRPGSVIADGNTKGQATVTVKATDGAFKSTGCQAWTKIR